MPQHYNYDNDDHDMASPKEMVPYIIDILHPKSVVDVGCGPAQWLRVFKDSGINDVLGIDGSPVPADILHIEQPEFMLCDLRKISEPDINRKFDLVLCLEVAEHLEPGYAHKLVETLVGLGEKIIFSAAVPNQTGENHLNEQYPDYWMNIFKKFSYSFLDPFREKFWRNPNVKWWYKQNMFLVVKNDLAKNYNYSYNGNVYIRPELLELQSSIAGSLNGNSTSGIGIRKAFRILLKEILRKFL